MFGEAVLRPLACCALGQLSPLCPTPLLTPLGLAGARGGGLVSVGFEEESNDVLMPGVHRDMQRCPSVARSQPYVGSVADQQLDEFEVAGAAALVERSLTVGGEHVDVDRLRRGQARPRRRHGTRIGVQKMAESTRVAAADCVQKQLMVSVIRDRRFHRLHNKRPTLLEGCVYSTGNRQSLFSSAEYVHPIRSHPAVPVSQP